MKASFTLLGALLGCSLLPAESLLVADEPQIIAGSFTPSDLTVRSLALWFEGGLAEIRQDDSAGSRPTFVLPAETPEAMVGLLLDLPDLSAASTATANFRFRLSGSSERSGPESLFWELAGVPVHLTSQGDERWQFTVQTGPEEWTPLWPAVGTSLGPDWHSLQLEFVQAKKAFRLRLDKGDASIWFIGEEAWLPLLVLRSGYRSELWVADVALPQEEVVSSAQLDRGKKREAGSPRTLTRAKEAGDSQEDSGHRLGTISRGVSASRFSPPAVRSPLREGKIRLQVLTSLEERDVE